jgi:hypothetical protein
LTTAALRELAAAGELEPGHQISKDAKSWTAAGLVSGLEFPLDTAIDRPFDVFISYSTRNAAEAQAVCTRLEQSGLRCWIAPRDLLPGAKWSEGVIDGLDQSRAMLVILSREANDSPQVQREAERALSKVRTLILFPLDDVSASGALKTAMAQASWRDECDLPLEKRIARLSKVADRLLPKRGIAPPSLEPPPEPEEPHEEPPAALWAWFSGAHAALVATAAAATLFVMGLAVWWFFGGEGAAGAILTGEQMRPSRISGEWSREGDELVQSRMSKEGGYEIAYDVVFGDEEWSRYNLSLKAKAVGGSNCFAVRFHVLGDRYRVFRLGSDNAVHLLSSAHQGRFDRQYTESRRGTIKRDHWYEVRIEVRGTSCRCLLDGVEWFSGEDSRLAKGRLALATIGSVVRFRDIRVTSEDGETVLWEGNPLL